MPTSVDPGDDFQSWARFGRFRVDLTSPVGMSEVDREIPGISHEVR